MSACGHIINLDREKVKRTFYAIERILTGHNNPGGNNGESAR